mgnify:CR=1 FL=1
MESLVLVFLLHFVADFVLQPYWMKIQKSRIPEIMALHVIIYTIVLFTGLQFFYDGMTSFYYASVNGVIHLFIDFISSRIISKSSNDLVIKEGDGPLYERVDMYYPIILLGIDQLLHHISLIITWFYIFH